MDLSDTACSDSEKEDKSWQKSCNIFNQSEQQFMIKTELKQEHENKIWQKEYDIFDRVCMHNKPDDVFGTLIKQVEQNRKSKKPDVQLVLAKNTSPKKSAIRMQEKSPGTSSDESGNSSESQEKLQNKSPENAKISPHNSPEKITKKCSVHEA